MTDENGKKGTRSYETARAREDSLCAQVKECLRESSILDVVNLAQLHQTGKHLWRLGHASVLGYFRFMNSVREVAGIESSSCLEV